MSDIARTTRSISAAGAAGPVQRQPAGVHGQIGDADAALGPVEAAVPPAAHPPFVGGVLDAPRPPDRLAQRVAGATIPKDTGGLVISILLWVR